MDLLDLKKRSPIDEVVQELTGWRLTGRGNYKHPAKGTKEGGLVVNVRDQLFFWNSKDSKGDVIEFVQLHKGVDFKGAVEWLANRAGILPEQVVIWGRSLGGAVGVHLAATHGAAALILDRTFVGPLPELGSLKTSSWR